MNLFGNEITHYTVDGELLTMKQMRSIAEAIGYGAVAWHIPARTIVEYLKADGRLVQVFKPHF